MALPSLPRYVAAPGLVEPRFGLLSVINWQDSSDPHTALGIQFEPLACTAADITNALQCDDEPESPFGVPKATDVGVPLVTASPFAIYGSYSCGVIGRPLSEATERARAHLQYGRGRAIERAVQFGEAGNEPTLVGDASDITPGGGPVSLIDAVARLEQHLGENYGGTGVIWLSRRLTTHAISDALLYVEGDRLYTQLGTSVVAGTGYDESAGPGESPESPSDGEVWVYATGAVYGWQSAVGDFPEPVGAGVDRSFNNVTALAEQTYVIAWECLTVAIQVDPDTLTNDAGTA